MSAKTSNYEFGIDSFGDIALDEKGNPLSDAASIRQVVDEATLADKLGIDIIGLGEHHRADFAISSPEMVLAAIASKTKNIKLTSAVTVLSSDDPVRVYQRFATLDAVSNGRAEIIIGRGSFTESYPLFGYDLRDYERLFDEKIELMAELIKERPVTWSGTMRPGLKDTEVFPKTDTGSLPIYVGVGGTPQSVVRTARYGFGMMLAVIGGAPDRFKPYVELYRQASRDLGHEALPVGLHSPGFIAETDEAARQAAWGPYQAFHTKVGRDRGWPPVTRQQYEHEIDNGSLYIGSPETVAQKIANAIKVLDVKRFDLVYGLGTAKASDRLRTVELYGKEVIPRVRQLLEEK